MCNMSQLSYEWGWQKVNIRMFEVTCQGHQNYWETNLWTILSHKAYSFSGNITNIFLTCAILHINEMNVCIHLPMSTYEISLSHVLMSTCFICPLYPLVTCRYLHFVLCISQFPYLCLPLLSYVRISLVMSSIFPLSLIPWYHGSQKIHNEQSWKS